ncbi:MAG: Hsp20/alpha crystallin family protein [Candidatus Riflebacteria bacterium]|nr:Hsp20/alpha crystallin family protein [Candidatus Riflebacteria bacterium]
MNESEMNYTCRSCGNTSSKEGELCNPLNLKDAYTCELCGNLTSDPKHLCKPKMAKLDYVCDNCGQVSVDSEFLCNPRSLKWAPQVDLLETEEGYVIEVDLPGVMKESLNLELLNGVVELKGMRKCREGKGHYHMAERMSGSFQRSIVLPDSVESDKIEANFADGILHITISKSKESRAKKVAIAIK